MKVRTFTFVQNKTIVIHPISITAIGSISALGTSFEEVWAKYLTDKHCFVQHEFSGNKEWIAPLSESAKDKITAIRNSDAKYNKLDESVLFALYASRQAVLQAGWKHGDDFGINIGSSRGATALFEKYHQEFIRNKKTQTLTSPTTTLGNISSWVAHDLNSQGPEISHSITCSTALHALLNGVAWIKSGMADKFLVGGSEAPLTPFTLAQMKALKIYAPVTLSAVEAKSEEMASATLSHPTISTVEEHNLPVVGSRNAVVERSRNHPCQALNLEKKQNSMILGEGAAVACLEKGISEKALAIVEGVGYATEVLQHNISISSDAVCFQKSMQMALGEVKPSEVGAIVMHAPGTIKGDISEYHAIKKIFGNTVPALTTNKWKLGHTFGASGMLNVELAVLMLQHQKFIKVPFMDYNFTPKKLDRIMVNSVGFGGNAVSILLRNPF